MAKTAAELAALADLPVSGLAGKYEELFGAPCRTRNKQFLRKRLAFKIQELAEGGLSPRALARIEELQKSLPPLGVKSHPNFPLSSHREIPPSRCESWTSWGGSSGVCSFFSASFQ